jgi:4-diphosphocytidyl-2-C-methyl-D-erythritol kinase
MDGLGWRGKDIVLSMNAPAKINLSLEVVGKRPDGFHEIVSVMQTVSLCDRLEMTGAKGVTFSCSVSRLSGATNLVVQAADLVRKAFSFERGCDIYLKKNVPTGAGLGGGSSDAAAALIGLARLWDRWPGCGEFRRWAERLGSDVPFFLYGGPALVEGKGEKVTPLRMVDRARQYLLVAPRVEVSTRRIFEALPREAWTDGSVSQTLARSSERRAVGINGLQSTLFHLYPDARACFEEVQQIAPGRCIVSGTGPTVVALMDSEEEAREADGSLARLGFWTEVVTDYEMESWQTPCAQG